MPLNNAGKVAMANGLDAVVTHFSLHTAAPDATGSNPSAAARVAGSFTVDASGNLTVSSLAFTGGAASGPVHSVGFWSAATAGTYYGSQAIESGDTSFNAAGEYTVNTLTLNTTATD